MGIRGLLPTTVAGAWLVAASIALIAGLSAIVAFKGWPGSTVQAPPARTVTLAEPPSAEAPVQRVVVGTRRTASLKADPPRRAAGRPDARPRAAARPAVHRSRRPAATTAASRPAATAPAAVPASRPVSRRRPAAAAPQAPVPSTPAAVRTGAAEQTTSRVAEAVGDALLDVRDALP